jgi:hypothetical protein
MPLEVSTQSRLQLFRHGKVRAARFGLYTADRSRGRVNALPDTEDMLCEVHVYPTECGGLTDPQAKHRRNRNDGAEWLWRIGDDSLHLIIGETTRLLPHALARQGQVCETEIPARITPGPCRSEKRCSDVGSVIWRIRKKDDI